MRNLPVGPDPVPTRKFEDEVLAPDVVRDAKRDGFSPQLPAPETLLVSPRFCSQNGKIMSTPNSYMTGPDERGLFGIFGGRVRAEC